MNSDMQALRFPLLIFAGWVNRHQQRVIEYLVEENRVLKEQMGGRRVRLNDDLRRRLAAKPKGLGRQTLDQIATIVTPDTLMRWYRHLIALKWTYEADWSGRRGRSLSPAPHGSGRARFGHPALQDQVCAPRR